VAIGDLSGGDLTVDADGLVVWEAMLDVEDSDRRRGSGGSGYRTSRRCAP
jgi:hypothetical protein